MEGRNYIPPNALKYREVPFGRAALIEDTRGHHRLPISPPPPHAAGGVGRLHPAIIEDHIEAQRREIQSLLLDNQRLAATHVALKQDLVATKEELRRLSIAADDVKGERDAQVREVYERSRRLEAEVRSIDDLEAELGQVRGDIQKLTEDRRGLTSELQGIDGDLARARSELQQFPSIKAEIESLQLEIQRGRAAVECENKTRASNLEHDQAMEKHMISMAREIKKLRAELDNAEKRARAAAAAAVAATPSPGYAGSSYPDHYPMHQEAEHREANYISTLMAHSGEREANVHKRNGKGKLAKQGKADKLGPKADKASKYRRGKRGGEKTMSKVKCYNCGEKGHFARDCSEPKKEQ